MIRLLRCHHSLHCHQLQQNTVLVVRHCLRVEVSARRRSRSPTPCQETTWNGRRVCIRCAWNAGLVLAPCVSAGMCSRFAYPGTKTDPVAGQCADGWATRMRCSSIVWELTQPKPTSMRISWESPCIGATLIVKPTDASSEKQD